MVLTCPACGAGMEAPSYAQGRGVRCPACGNVFTPVLPRADVVDIGTDQAHVESSGDVDILWPTDVAPQPAWPQYVPRPDPRTEAAKAAADLSWPDGRPNAADCLANLAAGRPMPFDTGRFQPDSDRPEGWFVKTDDGEDGPLTSREVASRAYRGQLAPDTVLINYRKGVRVPAGRVPFLFRKAEQAAAEKTPDPQGDDEPGWYVEMSGRKVGPMTRAQVELAARRGILAKDAVLTYPQKAIRVLAGAVPRLFPDSPAGAGPADRKPGVPVADAAKEKSDPPPSMDVHEAARPQEPPAATPPPPPGDPLAELQSALTRRGPAANPPPA